MAKSKPISSTAALLTPACWRACAARVGLPLLLLLACANAIAQDVRLVGTVGSNRAIVVLGDGTPRTLSIGQTRDGVTLVSVERNRVVVRSDGEEYSLKLGESPARITGSSAQSLRMPAQPGGHYMADGQINGHKVQFMVDTGASTVSMDAQLASTLGIDYQKGRSVKVATANGQVQGWLINLPDIRVGGLQQTNISATVVQQAMPFVLLGNSFLNHYRMTRDATSMVLESR